MWAIVVVLTIAQPLAVLTQSVEQQASAMAHRLMSPYCPGLLLADCRSDGAQELRTEILHRLQAGEAPDAIERDLVTRFGPAIRTEPEFNGIGLVAWLSPFVFAVAGLGIVFLVVRRAASRDPASVAHARDDSEGDAGMNERLQDELDALD